MRPARWYEQHSETLAEVTVLGLNVLAAAAYLLVMGLLMAGDTLAAASTLLVAGIVLDAPSEIWLYTCFYRKTEGVMRELMVLHYLLLATAYGFLATAVFDLAAVDTLTLYTVFLLLWMLSFLLGETVGIAVEVES